MARSKDKSLIEEALGQASDAVDAAKPALESLVTQAKEQMIALGKDASAMAQDAAEQAKEKAGPMLAEGKAQATEKAAQAAEYAAAKASEGADKAAEFAVSSREAAASAVAGVKGESDSGGGHKIRNLVIIGSLVAAGGWLYSKFRTNAEADNWQSAYAPESADVFGESTSQAALDSDADDGSSAAGSDEGSGRPLVPGVGPDEPLSGDDPMARAAEDQAGASPDEALADQAEEPHEVTTPDAPDEVIEVADDGGKASKKS